MFRLRTSQERAAAKEQKLAQRTLTDMRAEPGANDPTQFTERAKLLGAFVVEPQRFTTNNGDVWKQGDPYLDVTVPPLMRHELTPEALKESHHKLAQYVGANALHAYSGLKAVGGITSTRWQGYATRRFGMHAADIPEHLLPADYVQGAAGIYEQFATAEKPFEPVMLYQTPGQLLAHYEDTTHYLHDPGPRKYDYIPTLDANYLSAPHQTHTE